MWMVSVRLPVYYMWQTVGKLMSGGSDLSWKPPKHEWNYGQRQWPNPNIATWPTRVFLKVDIELIRLVGFLSGFWCTVIIGRLHSHLAKIQVNGFYRRRITGLTTQCCSKTRGKCWYRSHFPGIFSLSRMTNNINVFPLKCKINPWKINKMQYKLYSYILPTPRTSVKISKLCSTHTIKSKYYYINRNAITHTSYCNKYFRSTLPFWGVIWINLVFNSSSKLQKRHTSFTNKRWVAKGDLDTNLHNFYSPAHW